MAYFFSFVGLSAFAYNSYRGVSSIQFSEAENTVQIFETNLNRGSDQDFEASIGLAYENEAKTGAALGTFFGATVTKIAGDITLRNQFSATQENLTGAVAQIGI